jgi:hypothetical protein
LLAAMQRGVAFRTVAVPVDPVLQLRGTIETPCRGHRLYQARQARTCYVERRFRTRGPGPLVAAAAVSKIRAIRVPITRLSILSIAVHGELRTPKIAGGTKLQTKSTPWSARFVAHYRSITTSAVRQFRLPLLTSGYRRDSVERPNARQERVGRTRRCRKSICTTVRLCFAR